MPDAAALLLRSAQQLGIYTAKDAVQQDFMVKKKQKKKNGRFNSNPFFGVAN